MTTDVDLALRGLAQLYAGTLPELPPAMTGEDVPLYLAWKARPGFPTTKAYFNVRVGPPREELERHAPMDARIRAQLASPRIDMLAHDGTGWWILEFHGHGGTSQVGRLLCYPNLLRRTYDVSVPLRSALVAWTLNPFLLDCYTDLGLTVWTYGVETLEPTLLNPSTLRLSV